MRIGLVQVDDAPNGEAAIIPWMTAAIDRLPDAQMVIWPELALCGYDCPQRIRRQALARDGDTLRQIADLARRRRQTLVFGYAEQAGERLYNALCAIGPQGECLTNYRKIHLWSGYESALFTPGEDLQSFVLNEIRFGMAICYDLDFPELSRQYAQQGAACLLCISATTQGYELIPQQVVPTRAYENGYFVVFANRGDSHGPSPCIGMSRLAGPDGQPLAALAGAGAGTLITDLDISALKRWRQQHPGLQDRRSNAYHLADH
ncbi:nitrilase-related carbon-nitrogen hydrolase [Biostraticola tofi]|uniref:Putative amidohydrolase n=1 Tax=Biostraticola tofi TaxID=466109 RepID=A0A4R3Z3F5_9GAMM|nr:nitrilase-related carbon-nitrogen hydrolase [Biostraticola tofi]TCV98393.1 putative amidohydrolase [Biostraticola tofi]